MDSPNTGRRIWPLALILLAVCGATLGYARWSAAASQPRLEQLVREAIAKDLNETFGPALYSPTDIRLEKTQLSPTQYFYVAKGQVTIQRRTFRSAYKNGGSFTPAGDLKLEFQVFFSKARESLAIARPLGPIHPTLRLLYIGAYRKPPMSSGMPIDIDQEPRVWWEKMERATDSDLFDVKTMLAPVSRWDMQLWPDSFIAIEARTLRAQGKVSAAADVLLANLSDSDASRAPLVRSEVAKINEALAPGDPRIARLNVLMQPHP